MSSLTNMAAVASTSPTDDVNAPRELKLIPKNLATSLPQLTPSLSGPRRSHRCRRDDRELSETSKSGEFYIIMPQMHPHLAAGPSESIRRPTVRCSGRTLQSMMIGRPRKQNSDSSSTSTKHSVSSSKRSPLN